MSVRNLLCCVQISGIVILMSLVGLSLMKFSGSDLIVCIVGVLFGASMTGLAAAVNSSEREKNYERMNYNLMNAFRSGPWKM